MADVAIRGVSRSFSPILENQVIECDDHPHLNVIVTSVAIHTGTIFSAWRVQETMIEDRFGYASRVLPVDVIFRN